MGITCFTGLPGAGKTYRVVSQIMKKGLQKKYFVIHNIDGLKPELAYPGGHIKTISEICASNSIEESLFYTPEVQSELSASIRENYDLTTLIVLDEAQTELFEKDPLKLEWLTKHRHYDQDIWLITQTQRNIAACYRRLIELEIRGKKGPVFPFFIYVHRSEGQRIGNSRLGTNKKVFAAYKSFEGKGLTGARSNWLKYAVGMIAAAACFGVWLTSGNLFGADQLDSSVVAAADVVQEQTGVVVQEQSQAVGAVAVSGGFSKYDGLKWAGKNGADFFLYNYDGLYTLNDVSSCAIVLRWSKRSREITIVDCEEGLVIIRGGRVSRDFVQFSRAFGGNSEEVSTKYKKIWVWGES